MVMTMMQDNDMFGDGSFVSGALGNLVLLTKVNGFPEMGKIMMMRMTMMMKVLIIVIDNYFDIHVDADADNYFFLTMQMKIEMWMLMICFLLFS